MIRHDPDPHAKRIVLTVEFGSDQKATDSDRPLATSDVAMISQFIGWLGESGVFRACIIVPKSQRWPGLLKRKRVESPEILTSFDGLVTRSSDIVRLAREGYRVIFSSDADFDSHASFFRERHMPPSAPRETEMEQSALFDGAWNRSALAKAMETALSGKGRTHCCFAHNADPAYVFSQYERA